MLAKNATSINYFRKYPSTRDPYIYGTLHETSRDSHRCNEIPPLRNHHVCTIHPPPPSDDLSTRTSTIHPDKANRSPFLLFQFPLSLHLFSLFIDYFDRENRSFVARADLYLR